MGRTNFVIIAIGLALAALGGCSSESTTDPGSSASGGSAGSGLGGSAGSGTGGTGGGAGTGGAGTGGAAGTGGVGGAGTGGAAGTGGVGGAGTGGGAGSGGTAGTGGVGGAGGGGTGGSGGDLPCGVPDPEPPCTATDIAGKLACIPGMTVSSGTNGYNLTFEQLLDHGDPSRGTFQQRLLLRHVSETAPMVLAASGYSLSTGTPELNRLFEANLIQVEHRFFAQSVPAGSVPWELLTIRQSAIDFHKIWAALKWLYPGAWVNTGASKGGETSVFYRRFFPCDLQGTVAYVAPIVYGVSDARFVDFVNNAGGAENAACRQNLADIQRAALEKKAELIPRMNAADYQHLGPAVAFEHSVLEIPFGFWQYRSPSECATLPPATATTDELWDFVGGELDLYTDSSIAYYTAYFYAAAFELGAPAVENKHVIDVLDHWDSYVPQTYLPAGVTPVFDPNAMVDVQNWVSTAGDKLMFIYGSFDPWTAAQYELGSSSDSFKYFVQGGNHGSSIGALAASDSDAAVTTLERWFMTPSRIPASALPKELPREELRDAQGRLVPPPRR